MQSNPKTSRSIQETLSDLHSIFIWGEKAAPFLEDLIEFIESLTPLIEEINVSLHESAKRFPSAQSQLDDVTKATELATNEILGLLENSLDECNVIDKENKADIELVNDFAEFKSTLRSDIRGALSESDPRVHVLHAKLWHQTDKLVTNLQASSDSKKKAVSLLRSKLNKILMSLQVQDITTQQISAVIHVIQSIRSRLSELYDRLSSVKHIEGPGYSLSESREVSRLSLSTSDTTEPSDPAALPEVELDDNPIPLESGSTFDANASYDKSKSVTRQKDADQVVEQMLAGEIQTEASPDEANEKKTEEEAEPVAASNDDIDNLFASGGDEASSDDIDNLFASGGDEASSDDIDKLFGN